MVKNEICTVEMTGYTAAGEGVCRVEGRAVFVPGALTGESWDIRILKVTSSAAWARGERLLLPSPERREPGCSAAGKCGGCALLHMSYAEELRFKRQRVNDALRRIGGLDFAVEEILPAAEEDFHRRKAIFNVGADPAGRPVAGFYRPRSHEIVSAPDCALVRPEANAAAAGVIRWMECRGIPAYDELAGRDGVRHILVRSSRLTGSAVVTLVTSLPLAESQRKALIGTLRLCCPSMTGLTLCLNRQKGNVVLAGEFTTLWGEPLLTESLCGLRFELSPRAFFQVNPPQAEKLYERAVALAAPPGTGLALDLYCGTGTIGLCMASRAQRVLGVEVVPEAVENARANALRNGVGNAEFLCADAEAAAQELRRRGERPDAVVVDPPRKGLAPGVIDCLAGMAPPRIVYVSCDPGTLARDLSLLAKRGYAPASGCAVDMFPRTVHVETVVLMSRAKE